MKLLQINTVRNLSCVFLGLIFFTSGMSKLYFEHQFVGIIGPVWLEKELAEYGLGMYARFIGYSQVCVGFLLFTLRYSTLGAVMLIPLVGNIFMVTVSMNWKGTPYVLAVFLLMNVFVIWVDRKILMPIVTGIPFEQPLRKQSLKGVFIWFLALVLLLASINISYVMLPIAYALVLAAIVLAVLSYKLDKK